MTNPILIDDLADIHERFVTRDRLEGAHVVVTGAGGFLGYYLTHYFARYRETLGIRGLVLVDPAAATEGHWLRGLVGDAVTLVTDAVEAVSLAEHVPAGDRLYVVHAASIASPTFYRQFPIKTIDANIWGLRHLLDQCSQFDLAGFLFFSSSEIYGDPEPSAIPTNEEYRGNVSCTGPRACYDESKRFGETISWVYASEHGMPITVARPFNNYGPGMSPRDRRLPADLASRVLAGEDIEIYSSGTPTRTFCYVTDAVVGYLACLTHGTYDYFNIGNDTPELSVREFAEIFRAAASEVLGYRGAVVSGEVDDPEYLTHNPQRRCPDLSKAREHLGYRAVVDVETGVRRYLEFLRHERAGQ
jgi:Nucleoside-diphosphate-sugar epimerases